MICSFTNYAATATVTASSDTGGDYGVANWKTPERRKKPWKSATIASDVDIVFNFGAPRTLGLIGFPRLNVASVIVAGNATDSWGAPTYGPVTRTIGQNPFNFLRTHGYAPVGFTNLTFLRVRIPAQAPIVWDAAFDPTNLFLSGGLFAGPAVTPPGKFNVDWEHEPEWGFEDVGPSYPGAWTERHYKQNPIVTLRRKRTAKFTEQATYASTDDATKWLRDISGAAWVAGHFALLEDLGEPSLFWIVRQQGTRTPWGVEAQQPGVANNDWELREVYR